MVGQDLIIDTSQEMWLTLEQRLDEIRTIVVYGLKNDRQDMKKGIVNVYQEYRPRLRTAHIERAIDFAVDNHKTERENGDPYVVHPIETGYILTLTGTRIKTIIAGILHDAIEENYERREDIISEIYGNFGAEVLDLVTALTPKPIEDSVAKKYLIAQAIRKKSIRDPEKSLAAIRTAERLSNLRTVLDLSSKPGVTSTERIRNIIRDTEENILPLAEMVDSEYNSDLKSYTVELIEKVKESDLYKDKRILSSTA
jgi:guanosine-3',5'-bis(diphosphate) 3'-pyrophosphohydrolase